MSQWALHHEGRWKRGRGRGGASGKSTGQSRRVVETPQQRQTRQREKQESGHGKAVWDLQATADEGKGRQCQDSHTNSPPPMSGLCQVIIIIQTRRTSNLSVLVSFSLEDGVMLTCIVKKSHRHEITQANKEVRTRGRQHLSPACPLMCRRVRFTCCTTPVPPRYRRNGANALTYLS